MKKEASIWSKHVRCELINREMTIADLAESLGKSREFVSGIVNGRVISEPTIDDISDFLDVPNSGITSTGSLIITRKDE